jgi:hypothetical protein
MGAGPEAVIDSGGRLSPRHRIEQQKLENTAVAYGFAWFSLLIRSWIRAVRSA